jgi:hypothetical protein
MGRKKKPLTEKQWRAQQIRWERGDVGIYRTRQGEVFAEIARMDPKIQAQIDAIFRRNRSWLRWFLSLFCRTPA